MKSEVLRFITNLTHGRSGRLEDNVAWSDVYIHAGFLPSMRGEAGAKTGVSSVLIGELSGSAKAISHNGFPIVDPRRAYSGQAGPFQPVKTVPIERRSRLFLEFSAKGQPVSDIQVKMSSFTMQENFEDLPRTITSESSASSSAGGGSGDHRSSTSSSDMSVEATPSEARGAEEVGCSVLAISTTAEVVVFEGWESKVINGRLDNLCKAPKTLPVGFRFRTALHHKLANGAAMIMGYKKLEEMVRRYQIPKTILIRAGTPNKWACTVSRTGWVPVYVDHFDPSLCFPLLRLIFDVLVEYKLALTQLTPNSIKFIIGFMLLCERLGVPVRAMVFRSLFLCRLCPSTSGSRWYYISGRGKMMTFTNIRNKVVRWKKQFIFVRDTRTERINNEFAARLSKWRTPNAYMNYPQLTVGDIDLKNQLLDHVKARGLVDLEALVTPEQLVLVGFVNVTNLHAEATSWRGSVNKHKARGTVELGPVPNIKLALTTATYCTGAQFVPPKTSMRSQPASAAAVRPANVPPAPTREVAEPAPASSSASGPRIAYSESFSYVRTDCQAAMAFSYTVALFECDSKMANRAASTKSRADELARKVNELREELEKAQAEKSGIQAAKEEAVRAEDRAKKAESDKEKAFYELNSLKDRVAKADQHVTRTEASLEQSKKHHQRAIYFAWAQGAEWLVGADMFQDADAVASANTTTDIFNEIRGKVLRQLADFPISELAFFEGEEMDEQAKRLTPPADTQVKLKWELNEEGLLVWPPSVVEKGEDTVGLPNFDAWVANPQEVPAEPYSTPPSSQPTIAAAPALSPPDRSSLA
ncbi:hypothetical protein SLEP1_g26541 [Rubroshorea leprosula]|uniref:Transposase (putative) gypsy type domain-containing protein n=1 Tax=Rubroshorea leprosula TaxID=152421 RepID=A0AAV5JZU6_9ROSI|nr:hypothetical protein SLEP1_g26541 [Rubroshorea leprosula]